jgi:gamma-glutamylcyclotransferase (GGCT)/AIG2-like uncharacterized protein YtfP
MVSLLQERTYTFVPAAMHTLQPMWGEGNERARDVHVRSRARMWEWSGMDAGSQRDSAPVSDSPLHRLATYGSLAPGRPNNHQLDGLKGRWFDGHVCGRLINAGWGADLGYPALILDPKGPATRVHIFESPDLPEHWSRLDDFEGSGYQRVVTTVDTSAGDIEASIYVLRAVSRSPGC